MEIGCILSQYLLKSYMYHSIGFNAMVYMCILFLYTSSKVYLMTLIERRPSWKSAILSVSYEYDSITLLSYVVALIEKGTIFENLSCFCLLITALKVRFHFNDYNGKAAILEICHIVLLVNIASLSTILPIYGIRWKSGHFGNSPLFVCFLCTVLSRL